MREKILGKIDIMAIREITKVTSCKETECLHAITAATKAAPAPKSVGGGPAAAGKGPVKVRDDGEAYLASRPVFLLIDSII